MQLIPGTKWLYLGGEKGFNLVHTLLDVDEETDPKMPNLISYSDSEQEDENEPGWTWRGPLNLFLKAFKPLGPAEEQFI